MTKRKAIPAKRGRKPLVLDLAIIERLAGRQASLRTIAAVMGVDEKTLRNKMRADPNLSALIEKGRESGKATLLEKQWEGALQGDRTLLIWLGKQYLDQSDVVRQRLSGPHGGDPVDLHLTTWSDLMKSVDRKE